MAEDDEDPAIAAACAVWSGVSVDGARLREHITRASALAPGAALAVHELVLAFACAQGDPKAIEILDRDYLVKLRAALVQRGLTASAIDETLQLLRHELLVPPPGASPRILNYGGRGPLHGWLRAVATRIGLRRAAASGREGTLDESRDAQVADDDLELAYMKKTYGEAFQRAFTVAFAALSADDRLLLKQRFRHRLTVEELGRVHGVHAGTVSRWVTAAREQLVKATRAEMMRTLGVGGADLESILRLIHSQIEITLSTRGE